MHGIPVALPVNVALYDGDLVFTTDTGSKLDAAVEGNVVSVEADGVDRLYHTGWSVLVTGVAEVLTDPDDIERVQRLPLQAWAPGPHRFLVRVPSTIVSGRRLGWGPAPDVPGR
jgi:nitroimidazol reductase NimA-like FMN-containing flavoprotein (pyridoxamine 5'-phosphate oxidase superfamily)